MAKGLESLGASIYFAKLKCTCVDLMERLDGFHDISDQAIESGIPRH